MTHLILIIDVVTDQIIEKVEVKNNINEQKKNLKEKYKNYKVYIKDGYLNVSEELFNKTKDLLEKCQQEYPEMFEEIFDKERMEFRHLGYRLKKQ